MNQPVYKWIILLLCFATHNLQAQTRVIDSLKQLYKNAADGDNKLSALFNLCEQHQSIQKDTLYLYAVEAGKLANDTHDKINKGRAAVILINAYLRKGKIHHLWYFVPTKNFGLKLSEILKRLKLSRELPQNWFLWSIISDAMEDPSTIKLHTINGEMDLRKLFVVPAYRDAHTVGIRKIETTNLIGANA